MFGAAIRLTGGLEPEVSVQDCIVCSLRGGCSPGASLPDVAKIVTILAILGTIPPRVNNSFEVICAKLFPGKLNQEGSVVMLIVAWVPSVQQVARILAALCLYVLLVVLG